MKQTPSASEKLRPALVRAASAGLLPYGVERSLAEEFGVSHQLVAQVKRSLGLTSAPAPRRCPPRYRCVCSALRDRRELCERCRRIALPCACCGSEVLRTPSQIIQSAKIQSGDTVRVLCDQVCATAWAGTASGHQRRARAKHQDVEAALQAAVVGGELPWGVQRRIAKQFGVSNSIVSDRAKYLRLAPHLPTYRRIASRSTK